MVISVCSLKGGVGKTTSAMLLAMCAAEEDEAAVTLIDGDPEFNAVIWANSARKAGRSLPFDVVRGEAEGLARQARALASEGRVVVVDTPPNSKDVMMAAALAADVAVVPVSPSTIDLSRLSKTLAVLLDVQSARSGLGITVLITRYSRGTVLAKVSADVLREHPVLPKAIRDLERYKSLYGTVPTYLSEYRENWLALVALLQDDAAAA